MLRTALIAIAALAVALASCDDSRIYSHFAPVDNEAWGRSDTLRFAVPPQSDALKGRARVMMRISPDYEFRNLSLIVRTATKPSQHAAAETTISIDTIECTLTDSKGHIEGRGVMHREFSFSIKDVALSPTDTTVIAISHNMRRMEIAGIEDVGVELRR